MADPDILLVGRGSFLARGFLAAFPGLVRRAVSHDRIAGALPAELLEGVGCIVNFAWHPAQRREPYRRDRDLDLVLARQAAARGLHYVLLSTRMVYAPAAAPLDETAALGPGTVYGANKLETERAVRTIPGAAVTVLRIGNVIGFEAEAGRGSFMGRMMADLKATGLITLDVSPFVLRDFMPLPTFCRRLAAILVHRPEGVFNLGSGQGTPVGRIALWLMAGFGGGRLLVADPRDHDGFVLHIGKISRFLGNVEPGPDLAGYCHDLGRALQNETARPDRV